jgi:anti-sigma-K factor RskA
MNGPGDVPELTCDEVREMAGSFVLGALTPADDAAVRAHLASCDDAHAEIDELGGVVPALAASVPAVEPPEALKARIMASAAADLDARRAGMGGTATASADAPTAIVARAPTTAPVPTAASTSTLAPAPTLLPTTAERAARRSRPSTATWLLRIAAVFVIAVLGGWNVLLQGQLDTAKSYQQSVATVLDLAAQPGSLTAVLTADGGTGNGLAAISSRGEFAMAMDGLASTSGDAVYEAWFIGSDRVPKPIGSFTVGNTGTAQFNITVLPPAPGAIVALTLEPTPKPTTPTLPIVSKGVANAAG